MKSIGYYALMYGGSPMTANGAMRFLVMALNDGHKIEDCVKHIPNEYLSSKGMELKT